MILSQFIDMQKHIECFGLFFDLFIYLFFIAWKVQHALSTFAAFLLHFQPCHFEKKG